VSRVEADGAPINLRHAKQLVTSFDDGRRNLESKTMVSAVMDEEEGTVRARFDDDTADDDDDAITFGAEVASTVTLGGTTSENGATGNR
jgi:hypothetical protein